jgi:hypothetical protein
MGHDSWAFFVALALSEQRVEMATSYTAADIATIEAAILTAITDGVASVSVAGQSVQTYSLKELREMLAFVEGRLASARPHNFLKPIVTVPPGTG